MSNDHFHDVASPAGFVPARARLPDDDLETGLQHDNENPDRGRADAPRRNGGRKPAASLIDVLRAPRRSARQAHQLEREGTTIGRRP